MLTSRLTSLALFSLVLFSSAAYSKPLYFGFYASDSEGAGTGSYMDQVKDQVNVAWVRGKDNLQKFKHARELHLNVALEISELFFDSTTFNLLPDYKKRWHDYAEAIRPHIRSVAVIYPLDEPYLQAKHVRMPKKRMLRELEIVGKLIKSDFPHTPIAMIFTWEAIAHAHPTDPLLSELIPQSYNWIGFDCYRSWDDCYGHSIPWYLDEIKKVIRPEQRTIIFPDSYVPHKWDEEATEDEQREVIERNKKFFELAISDSSVIGVFSFLYQTYGEDGTKIIGARDLPMVKSWYERNAPKLVQFTLRTRIQDYLKRFEHIFN